MQPRSSSRPRMIALRRWWMTVVPVGVGLVLASGAASAQETPFGIGGGGWISAGAFHVNDPDILLIGTDVAGVAYSTDRGQSFTAYSEGLVNSDLGDVRYVDDLLSISSGGDSGFFAATHGGVFYRGDGDAAWTDRTAGEYYLRTNGTEWPLAFSSLAYDGLKFVFAGMGNSRYNDPTKNNENQNPDFVTRPIWYTDVTDGLDAPWNPIPFPPTLSTGSPVRDISATRLNNKLVLAIATRDGVFWYNSMTNNWINLSPNDDDCWSVHLTPRGTLYASFAEDDGTPGDMRGVYRITDVRQSSTWTATFNPSGSVDLYMPWLSVRDGSGSSPDILVAATRVGFYSSTDQGVHRIEVVGNTGAQPSFVCDWLTRDTPPSTDLLQADVTASCTIDPTPVDRGWLGQYIEAETWPILGHGTPMDVFVPINAGLYGYDASANTWSQSYTNKTIIEDGTQYFTGRGQHETGIVTIAFTDDGELLFGTVDWGPMKSARATSGYNLTDFRQIIGDDATSQCALGEPCTYNGLYVAAVGSDIYFVSGLEGSAKNNHRLFHYDVNATPPYTDIAAQATALVTQGYSTGIVEYKDFVFTDDDDCFVVYDVRDQTAPATVLDRGVVQLTRNGATWDATVRTVGLPNSPIGEAILHRQGTNELFFAVGNYNSNDGGMYRLPDWTDPQSSWEKISSDPNIYQYASIAQSSDGSVLYAGTRGKVNGTVDGWGAVMKCTNPGAPAAQVVWTDLTGNNEFGYVLPKPKEGVWSSDAQAGRFLLDVAALTVDPDDANVVYVGVNSLPYELLQEGLWKYDGTNWSRVASERFYGAGVRSLAFTPCRSSGMARKLVVGHASEEMYSLDVGGSCPTGGGGGGGCPYVYTWAGREYLQENTILAPVPAGEFGEVSANVADAYVLAVPPATEDGHVRLQIREFENERTFLDRVALDAVEHPGSTEVVALSDGSLRLYENVMLPVGAEDGLGRDRLDLVSAHDGQALRGHSGDVLELRFEGLPDGPIGPILASDDEKNPDGLAMSSSGIEVQAFDEAHQAYVTVGRHEPREHDSLHGIELDDAASAFVTDEGALRVRLVWHADHGVDFVGLATPTDAQLVVRSARLSRASMANERTTVAPALASADGEAVEILPGQTLTLDFDVSEAIGGRRMARTGEKVTTTYVLRVDGHYMSLRGVSAPLDVSRGAMRTPIRGGSTAITFGAAQAAR